MVFKSKMAVLFSCAFWMLMVYFTICETKSEEGCQRSMEAKYYVVSRIDGDYAWLTCTSAEEEPFFIARALLPMEIDEGSKLKMENLQFEMI